MSNLRTQAAVLFLATGTLLIAGISCTRAKPFVASVLTRAPEADSTTVALYRFDEASGFVVHDAGFHRMHATAGRDARADFGRFGAGRSFSLSIESFAWVAHAPIFEAGPALTVEAWIYPRDFGFHEVSVIAARWTEQANEQSWLLGLVGKQPRILTPTDASPSYHRDKVIGAETGHLVFVFQPLEASGPLSFFSTEPIERQRWTHVAASYDGEVVRIHLDGRLDAQFATRNQIRPSPAPLLIGNYFDPDWLTDFGGQIRVAPGVDRTAYYAFDGWIDELRISRQARLEFMGVPER